MYRYILFRKGTVLSNCFVVPDIVLPIELFLPHLYIYNNTGFFKGYDIYYR